MSACIPCDDGVHVWCDRITTGKCDCTCNGQEVKDEAVELSEDI